MSQQGSDAWSLMEQPFGTKLGRFNRDGRASVEVSRFRWSQTPLKAWNTRIDEVPSSTWWGAHNVMFRRPNEGVSLLVGSRKLWTFLLV